MGGKHKPLQLSEVSSLLHEYIQWDMERKRIEGKGFHIGVICPLCGRLHWTKESLFRTGRCQSPTCPGCNARKVLTIDEVSDALKPVILWGEKREKKNGKWAMWVRCPSCGDQRLILETSLRIGKHSSGMCRSCSSMSQCGHKSAHWNGGRHKSVQGYIILTVNGLGEHERELAEPMLGKSRKTIREHRLVMALHLGRPLTQDEVVHHKDGEKANNKLENLELLTKKQHHGAHGNPYYQKWQEAESRIEELEAEILALKG